MNEALAKKLCDITNTFYRDNAASFSATRKSPWNGWRTSMTLLAGRGLINSVPLTVLDLASGNMRFAAFLASEYPENSFTVYGVDDCIDLNIAALHVHFQNLDIINHVFDDTSLAERIDAPLCDLSVCFGFMHHIPGQNNRAHVLEALLDKTKQGGYVVISFWMFMNNETLAKKAHLTHKQALNTLPLQSEDIAELDEGDFFLGWKDTSGSYRYCHNFSNAEIDDLAELMRSRASVTARFFADGRTDNLNAYIILQKN